MHRYVACTYELLCECFEIDENAFGRRAHFSWLYAIEIVLSLYGEFPGDI